MLAQYYLILLLHFVKMYNAFFKLYISITIFLFLYIYCIIQKYINVDDTVLDIRWK